MAFQSSILSTKDVYYCGALESVPCGAFFLFTSSHYIWMLQAHALAVPRNSPKGTTYRSASCFSPSLEFLSHVTHSMSQN